MADEHEIVITPTVRDEATRIDSFDARLIAGFITQKKVRLRDTREGKVDIRKLRADFHLAEGEASSLWLAATTGEALATDDGPTIRACKVIGVRFLTAIHFLVDALERGELSKALALAKLEQLERFGRYHPRILDDAKRRLAGEGEQ